MSSNALLTRDGSELDATASAVTKGCRPVAAWLKLCARDFAAVVGILFFVCYVLWGVPLTIRLVKACRAAVAYLRGRGANHPSVSSAHYKDLEGRGCKPLDSEDSLYQDPYHSPTPQLYNFLERNVDSFVLVPPATASPRDRSSSLSLRSSEMHETLQAKMRLAQFRFPPPSLCPPRPQSMPINSSDVFSISSYSYYDSDSDRSSTSTKHSCRNTIDELDDLVMKGQSCHSRRTPPCKRHSSDSSFALFDFGFSQTEDCLLGDSDDEKIPSLPASPPPAYLEQHLAFGSPSRFANVQL